MQATAEHKQATARGTGHEQHDQAEGAGGGFPLSIGEADAQACRITAHEGYEQAAEVQEADGVDISGKRAQRAGKGNVAVGIEHGPEHDRRGQTTVFMKSAGLKSRRARRAQSARSRMIRCRGLLDASLVRDRTRLHHVGGDGK